MSSTMPRGGLRLCTKSIQWPDRSVSADTLAALRLEAAHLTWRSRTALRGLASNNPANRRIVTQTFGIVHVFVAGESTEHRLPEHTDQRMATVLVSRRAPDSDSPTGFAIAASRNPR
jgi:hypothetical protein